MSRATDRAQFAGDTCEDRMGSGLYDADEHDMAEAAAHVAELAKAWRERWPGHCKACSGWGGSTYTEMHGFNHGNGEQMMDPCDALPDVHTCHRCGASGLNDEGEGPCTACGWNYDDGEPEL